MNLFYSLKVDMTRFFLHVSKESKISIIGLKFKKKLVIISIMQIKKSKLFTF